MPPDKIQACDPTAARIPARSRRHAMDWSLVLASQGIEAFIDQDPETGWGLVVPPEDYARALEAIRQYRMENLRWPWRKPVLQQRFVFDWASAIWALLAVFFFALSQSRPGFQIAGLMDTTRFADGQWWRLFTAIWLHADSAHLAANAGFGFVLLGLAMGHYGTGIGLLAAYLAGAGGNLADWLVFRSGHHSLGASGMVMGALGLIAIQSLSLRHDLPNAKKYIAGGIAAGVMLFVLLGLAPQTDVIAHFGGFASGLLLGALLSLFRRFAPHAGLNLLAGFAFAMLVILPWREALSAH